MSIFNPHNFTLEEYEEVKRLHLSISINWMRIQVAMEKALIPLQLPIQIELQIKQVSKSLVL